MKSSMKIALVSLLISSAVATEVEMVGKRSFFSKTFSLGDGNYNTVISTIPLHYKDENEIFQEITEGPEREEQMTLAYSQIEEEPVDLNNFRDDAYSRYEYQKMIIEWNGNDYDTTYVDTFGIGYDNYGLLGSVIYSTPPSDASDEGITDENWRALISWCTNCGVIPSGVEINSLELEINLNSVFIHPSRDYIVQLRSLCDYEITNSPSEYDYNTIASSSLIEEFNVEHYSYIYPYSETFGEYTSGTFFDDFTNSVINERPVYTMGFKHNTEYYGDYLEYESTTTTINSGTITIYYQIPEVTLVNQRKEVEESNLGGSISLEHLSGDEDYLDQPSGTSVPVFIDDDYTIWTHHEWLLDDIDSVKHYHWGFNNVHKIVNDNFSMPDDINKLAAEFDTTSTVQLSSPVPIYFRDPWYVSDPENFSQPNEFREITSGNFEVFLNQDPQQQDVYYSLRAPLLINEGDGIYQVFHRWVAMKANGDTLSPTGIFEDAQSRQTRVVFTDSVATVEAEYFIVTLIGEGVNLSESSGNLILFAPEYIVINEIDVELFDSWTISPQGGATIT